MIYRIHFLSDAFLACVACTMAETTPKSLFWDPRPPLPPPLPHTHTRGFYSRAASLQASSPFGGYGEKQTRERRARGDAKVRRRGVSPPTRAFSHGSLRSPKYSLRSRRLEVVGVRKNKRARARSFLHALLPSACYAGQPKQESLVAGQRAAGCFGVGRSQWSINADHIMGETSLYKPLAFYQVSSPLTVLIPPRSILPIVLQLKLYCFSRLRYLL